MSFFLVLFIVLGLLGNALGAKDPETLNRMARVTLNARFNPAQHLVTGEAQIELPPRKVVWIKTQGLTLKRVSLSGRLIEPAIENGRFRILATSAKQRLKIVFAARLKNAENLISRRAIVLTGTWFPAVEDLAYYDLRVRVPGRFRAVAPADVIKVKRTRKFAQYHFVFNHPQESPPLIAAPYHYYEKKVRGRTLAVYLLKPDKKLAQLYLKTIEKKLAHYEKLFGPYPYRRFAVVENVNQTGFAYPTLTLIGNRLLPLPFIMEISLPHELLHNWFGCGVYPLWEEGNWSEGLVTYLADHAVFEKKKEGALYRHRLLTTYESYVHPENEFPLREFRYRYNRTAQAIGYGKGALVFHMLRQRLGDELFNAGLRLFYEKHLFSYASWDDLRRAFEKVSNSKLESFFRQWIDRAGLPRLSFQRERIIPVGDNKYLVGLLVTQNEPYYELTLPLKVVSDQEEKETLLYISGPRARIDVEIKGKPLLAVLDPGYDVARHLTEPEFPPVISRLLGAEGGYLVLTPKRKINLYRPFLSFFKKRHFRLETIALLPSEVQRDLVYLDSIPEKVKILFPELEGDFCLSVQENPGRPDKIIAYARAASSQEVERALYKLVHLGDYQNVCTANGKIVLKERPRFTAGIQIKLKGDVRGTSLSNLFPLETIARAISLHQVIFLGEQHDRYEEHLAQLEIIKWLNEAGHRLAIGLEMFQRPFQRVLDAYIEGKLSEEEFLRQSEYFKRWGFNWKLYKPIIDYARKHRIPLVALNIRAEITDKVAKGGLKALSPEERALLPPLDKSNQAYRAYLRLVYESHPENRKEIKDFETFYEAQLLWDEAMAESIARYLAKHPERQMVVIVGRAHVAYGYGIPSRLARRGFQDYVIVLLSPGQNLSPAMADYVLFPAPEAPPFTARLGVLVEETPKGLVIRKVLPGRPAAKAGLKEGDVILKADGKLIKSVTDLKLALYSKRPEDKIRLEILRDGRKEKITVGPFQNQEGVK